MPNRRKVFRGRGGMNRDRSQPRERRPPGLRGRAIGLYYAQRNRERREALGLRKGKKNKVLGSVLLSDAKKGEIMRLLDSTAHLLYEFSDDDAMHAFRRKFHNLISGSIEDKLESALQLEQRPDHDAQLLREHLSRQKTPAYKKMLARRKELPSYAKKDEILQLINDNQVVVISGETGCGKTTQVAQFILDDFVEKSKGSVCHIVCTQPRRISAISVAERVAEERAEYLGNGVGYQIRLEKRPPRDKGSITYCTTGVVLKQMESDPCLSEVSHIILDEIHERDIMADFLIALLKQILTKRKDLKVILMSATLNAEKFSQYYNNSPHINIPGFTYPVEEFFLEDVLQRTDFTYPPARHSKNLSSEAVKFFVEYLDPYVRSLEASGKYSHKICAQLRNSEAERLNMDLVLALLINICETEKNPGAILVFVTGYSDIAKLHNLIENSGKFPTGRYVIIPLHSQMATVNQKQVFDRPPEGVRKIVIATNIAETSITIDDVVFVVDCGKIKMTYFNPETNTQSLQAVWVSQANASQRRGRAGRVQPGVCFHLFSRFRGTMLEQYQKPEILRTRIENTILTIKILQLGKVQPFLDRLMDSPDPQTVAVSLELLTRLNALDENETLTPLGYHLARLPMGPQVGKMILLGAIFSCLDPVLSVAASLDFKDPFCLPLGKEKEADKKRKELGAGTNSDHLLLYRALNMFEHQDHHASKQFCWEYFLSWHILTQLKEMKGQFMEYLVDLDFVADTNPRNPDYNQNSENWSLVKAVICAGLYPNVAIKKRGRRGNKVVTMDGEFAEFHMRSVLHGGYCESPLIIYHLKLKSSCTFLHDATMIYPLPLIFFGDRFQHAIDEWGARVSVGNECVQFKCSESTYEIVRQLRTRLNWFLEYKVSSPGVVDWKSNSDEIAILRAVVELITSEDIGDIDLDAFDDED